MASPWEGGHRPVKPNPSTDLAAELLASGDACGARLVSTGMIGIFEKFFEAECDRGSDPYEVVRAATIVTAAMMAEIVIKSAKPGRRTPAIEQMIQTWSLIVRKTTSEG